MAPYVWVEQIERDLEAGAWKVIAEARESGTAGIYRANGEVRTGLIDEIAHAIDPERLIFEAPLQRAAGVAAASTSAPSATSATSRPPTCSRSRRCASACARTPSSASRWAAGIERGGAARARRAGDGRRGTRRTADPLARVVFALLVLACFAAFFLTQRLKHTPTAVQRFKLTPRVLARRRPGRHQTGADLVQARPGRRGDGDDHRRAAATSWRRSCATIRCRATNSSRCAGTAAAGPRARYAADARPSGHADRSCRCNRGPLAPAGRIPGRRDACADQRPHGALAAQLHAGGAVSARGARARDEAARGRARWRAGARRRARRDRRRSRC